MLSVPLAIPAREHVSVAAGGILFGPPSLLFYIVKFARAMTFFDIFVLTYVVSAILFLVWAFR
jgi:hypothetical protein